MICLLQKGVSPLCIASQEGYTGIIQLLLDHGAQPNILTKVAIQYRHAVYDLLYVCEEALASNVHELDQVYCTGCVLHILNVQ